MLCECVKGGKIERNGSEVTGNGEKRSRGRIEREKKWKRSECEEGREVDVRWLICGWSRSEEIG